MDSLPDELRLHILSYLDTGPPSESKVYAEPSLDLTCSPDRPFKAVSRVSCRWRRLVEPMLFRNVRVRLRLGLRLRSMDGAGVWSTSREEEMGEFLAFLERRELSDVVETLVVYSVRRDFALDEEVDRDQGPVAQQECGENMSRIWKTVTRQLKPTSLKILAPPKTMAEFLSLRDFEPGDEWAFDMPYHIFELRQDSAPDTPNQSVQGTNVNLLNMRNWTRLGYNEGSSISAYSTYEFQWKSPPRVLSNLLADINRGPGRLAKTLCSFTYIAIFPLGTHVKHFMTSFWRIVVFNHQFRFLELQLVPQAHSNIMNDPVRMGRAQASDLWLEYDESMREFINVASWIRGPVDMTFLDYSDPLLAKAYEDQFADKLEASSWHKVGAYKWAKGERKEDAAMVGDSDSDDA
ncbi:hypothetical protein K490DRAFT_65202 [Saccharata proteae CBS 121410]|uniref:F-box domain-containing protein n=1 Tax=Saccharata proteae CBS 121410 TaxID=1314787 RepID=A0A9P4HYI7_9PEZI|nr:hypothetical protein K490DRAFT_65202 [Saccharata proteae CBS 121410]